MNKKSDEFEFKCKNCLNYSVGNTSTNICFELHVKIFIGFGATLGSVHYERCIWRFLQVQNYSSTKFNEILSGECRFCFRVVETTTNALQGASYIKN